MVGTRAGAARVRDLISDYIQLFAPRLLDKLARWPSRRALASARWFSGVAPECPQIL